MSDSGDEDGERTQSDRYNDPEADVVIISSDEVEFRVHSYHLMAASSVFRSVLSAAKTTEQKDDIILVDQTIEHSLVLGAILDMIHDLEVSASHVNDPQLLSYALDFASKWELVKVPNLVRQGLKASLTDNNGNGIGILLLAAKMNDHECISKVIKVHGGRSWSSLRRRSEATATGLIPRTTHSPLCPSIQQSSCYGDFGGPDNPWEVYLALPQEVTWALARSHSFRLADLTGPCDYDLVSSRYEHSIKTIEESAAGKQDSK